MLMNPLDAAFNTVNDYPGGAGSLAPRMPNKSASTLAHELRGQGSAKLGLVDAVKIMDLADNNLILLAIAAHRNCAVVPLPEGLDAVGGAGQHLPALLERLAAVVSSITMAELDNVVTANELADAERKWGALTVCGLDMLRTMRRRHEAGLPTGVGA
ncbi:phage regulatory CII family protein [Rhodoferax sp. WC2427]|uniref:phage regulatory CII family protein n=1 Tax=Rhodoferax sp. WC2427 TaxID=3234144 RepID=UPI003466768E